MFLGAIANNSEDLKRTQRQFKQITSLLEVNKILPELVENIVEQKLEKNKQKYRYPAGVVRAKIHRDAVKFGYSPVVKDGSLPIVCPCCEMKTNLYLQQQGINSTVDPRNRYKQWLSIFQPTTDINELNVNEFKLNIGTAMFFSFMKMIIYYLILRFLILDGFTLYTNYFYGNLCFEGNQNNCTNIFWTKLSTGNKQNQPNLLILQDIQCLAVTIISIIYFLIYKKYQYKTYDIINQNTRSQDDYTILVSNIPVIPLDFNKNVNDIQINTKQNLKVFFQNIINQWFGNELKWSNAKENTIEYQFEELKKTNGGYKRSDDIVKCISFCYNLQRIETLVENKEKLIDEYLNRENENEELTDIIQKKIVLSQQFAKSTNALFNITHFIGHAFVSFQYQHYRDYIMRQYEDNNKFLIFEHTKLRVSQAPDPTQIRWKNLRITQIQRGSKKFISFFLLSIILLVAFFIMMGMEVIKKQFTPNHSQLNSIKNILLEYWPTLVTTFMTLAINYVLTITIYLLSKFQKHTTQTEHSISLITKLVISQFINSALLYAIVPKLYKIPKLSEGGVIITISWLISFSAVIQILVSLFYWPHLIKVIKNWWKYRNLTENSDTVDTFQVRLNQQFQYPQFTFEVWYTFFIVQIYTVALFSYLIPISVPISIVLFILSFWVVKINLFKRSSLRYQFRYQMTRKISKIYQMSILIFAIGNFYFSYQFYLKKNIKYNLFGAISLLISVIYTIFIFLISEKTERRILGQPKKCQKPMYDDCIMDGKFTQTYFSLNPATSLVKEEIMTTQKRRSLANPARQKKYVSPQILSAIKDPLFQL